MQNDIKNAVQILKSGGIILYPTDTEWSIGCDATNNEAVAKICNLKQSKDCTNMVALIDSANLLNQYINEVPEIAWDLIDLTDKPLTIIYSGAKRFAPMLVAPDGSIGIRVVKHKFCERLIQALGRPIVAAPVNISGNKLPIRFDDIDLALIEGVDLVISRDYEESTNSVPSGIIKLGIGGQVKIIRE
jgi:L-threonylcarbamoyladenylate synthase